MLDSSPRRLLQDELLKDLTVVRLAKLELREYDGDLGFYLLCKQMACVYERFDAYDLSLRFDGSQLLSITGTDGCTGPRCWP